MNDEIRPDSPAAIPVKPGGGSSGSPLSEDQVELLKRYRELFLPDTRIKAADTFATWIFSSATIIGALAAGFSNAAFSKLSGRAVVVYGVALCFTGFSLAAASWSMSLALPDTNFQSLKEMLACAIDLFHRKKKLIRVAAACFAIALTLAGLSPLVSRLDVIEPTPGFGYSLGTAKIDINVQLRDLDPSSAITYTVYAVTDTQEEILVLAGQGFADSNRGYILSLTGKDIPNTTRKLDWTLKYMKNGTQIQKDSILVKITSQPPKQTSAPLKNPSQTTKNGKRY